VAKKKARKQLSPADAAARTRNAAHARRVKLGILPDLTPVVARNVHGIRLISKPEMLDRIGLSYPTVWKLMQEGKFPRSVVIGAKTAWVESEIEAWIAALPRRRLKGDDEQQQLATR
jgi:predicted DNA-binding transcriptional regulator AlpA